MNKDIFQGLLLKLYTFHFHPRFHQLNKNRFAVKTLKSWRFISSASRSFNSHVIEMCSPKKHCRILTKSMSKTDGWIWQNMTCTSWNMMDMMGLPIHLWNFKTQGIVMKTYIFFLQIAPEKQHTMNSWQHCGLHPIQRAMACSFEQVQWPPDESELSSKICRIHGIWSIWIQQS